MVYSVLFLTITGVEFVPMTLVNMLFGHALHFFFAAVLSNVYAKLRARKRNKKKDS
jgi:hypothetical protein